MQLGKIRPYWLNQVRLISELSQNEHREAIRFANRMKDDVSFARQWVLTMKQLFDIEDASSDKLLQK